MAKRTDPYQDEKGASARQLILIFLAAVAVCAVFFSLGFVVGYNHSPSNQGPTTETVTASGNIPPAVNPPEGDSGQPSNQGIQTENLNPSSTSIPKPVRPHPQPATTAPSAVVQTQTHKPVHQAKHQAAHKAAPKKVARRKPVATPRRHVEAHAPTRPKSDFAVQVMASRTRADAENLLKLLKSHGYRVYVLSPQQAHTKDHFFRVQVGPYPSRVSADSARDKLEGEGFRPFVVHH